MTWIFTELDEIASKQDVDYQDVLKWCNQETIWSWLMGKHLKLGEFFTNELRYDSNPSCYLDDKGTYIRLRDWSNSTFNYMNVFDACMYKYKCNLNEACKLIFYIGCNSKRLPTINKNRKYKKFNFQLSFTPRMNKEGKPRFTKKDQKFWSNLHISKEELIGEVFSNASYSHNSKANPNRIMTFFPRDLSYTYVFPDSGHKKIYNPNIVGRGKWLADIDNRDIWFKDYEQRSDILIVTKSYIDGKLVWKTTEHNVEALQNEGIIPSVSDITRWANTYSHIFFLYDIDDAGIKQSKKLVDYCNNIYEGKFTSLFLPLHLFKDHGITDCKDIVTKMDYYTLKSYLNFIINEKLVKYQL